MARTPPGPPLIACPDLVVLDTCVLMSNILRPFLLSLAACGCFRPAWSPVIADEWQRNASRIWNVERCELVTQWAAMEEAFPLANLGDVSAFKTDLVYSDRKDWHVIAAARAARENGLAQSPAILTHNIRDFSRSELRRLGIALFDPDQFLVSCLAWHPVPVRGLLALLAEDHPGELSVLLKRERLFRLNRLCADPASQQGLAQEA